MTFTLVMGGGGPVGAAWYAGLQAGLAECGVDLGAAETIIGTSAGALAGAWFTAEEPPAAPRERALALADLEVRLDLVDAAVLEELLTFMSTRSEASPDDLRRFGVLALKANAQPATDYVERLRPFVPGRAWPRALHSAVIDTETGELVLLGVQHGAPLAEGVIASCAPAGIVEPVEVTGRKFMDGGMRSGTNADTALSFPAERVLVLAAVDHASPFVGPYMGACLDREVALLSAGGRQVHIVTPESEDREAMSEDLLDVRRVPPAIEAGRARGRRLSETTEFSNFCDQLG